MIDDDPVLVTDGGYVEPINTGETALECGDRVVDREQSREEQTAAVVLELPGGPATDYYIDAIGATVADVNPEYDPESPVAVIAFEDGVERNGEDDATRYSYPSDRLKNVREDWTPARTSGQRARWSILEDHGAAADAFGEVLETILSDDDTVARLGEVLEKRGEPATRGGCRHSRDDEYRPEDDEAICCWECSTDLPRPKKLTRDAAAGPTCRTDEPAVVREVLLEWLRDVVGADVDLEAGVATDYRPSRFASDLESLRGDTDRFVRTAAVRLAWRATLAGRLDEDYNYQRALALLRDRGIDTDALLPGGGER